MAIGADRRMISLVILFAMHRAHIRRKTYRQTDVIRRHNTLISMTFAAHHGNVVPIDRALLVIGCLDVMTAVAVGTGCSRPVAVQPCHPVRCVAVIGFYVCMTGTATKRFLLKRIGNLVRSMAGQAVHFVLLKQWLMHGADELLVVAGMAVDTCFEHALIKVWLVRGMDVMT